MRARSIKPSICDNELLGTADPFCTLLFERLWMMADREGRLEDRPLRIKAQAFPYREGLDVEPILQWLHEQKFILRYSHEGTKYIQVLKFGEHQSPHIKEAPSKIPAPDKHQTSTVQAPDKEQPKPALAALTPSSLTPDCGLLTADSKKVPTEPVELKLDRAEDRVFDHWRQTHEHPKAQLDPKRRKVIHAALKAYSEADLCEAITGYRNSPHHMGENENNTIYDSIELFLRDSKHIDAGLRFARAPPSANSSVTNHNVRALNDWVKGSELHKPGAIRGDHGKTGGGFLEEDHSRTHGALLASARKPEH